MLRIAAVLCLAASAFFFVEAEKEEKENKSLTDGTDFVNPEPTFETEATITPETAPITEEIENE